MESHSNLALPHEITIEIFLLLPLESIAAGKLVCKEWRNLIKEPKFTNLYPLKCTAFFHNKLKLHCLFYNHRLFRIPIKISRDGDASGRFNLLGNMSNKIACIKTRKCHFHCYNPITRELYKVEDVPLQKHCDFWTCYGFGYDSYADDYKMLLVVNSIVRLLIKKYEGEKFDPSSVLENNNLLFVYSFRNRVWSLSSAALRVTYDWPFARAQGYSLNGALHWVVSKDCKYNLQMQIIAAIDLHCYKLTEMLLPFDTAGNNRFRHPVMLSELDGELCCCDFKENFDVWVMKEYGVEACWIKLLSIDRQQIRMHVPSFWYRDMVLFRSQDGRKVGMYFAHKRCLVLVRYDIATGLIEAPYRDNWPKD